MEHLKLIIIILAVLAVLFVPFYPFRLVKKFVLLLLNKFLPLPIKFDDIGGVPIIGIRLFNVRIALGGESSLTAREMRIRINLWKILKLRRPSVDPVTFFHPVISLHREPEREELWFLFPLNVARRLIGYLFANLWGTNKLRIFNGEIILHSSKGETRISNVHGVFMSQGAQSAVRSLECRIGQGTIQMKPVGPHANSDIRLIAHELPLNELIALKIPKTLTGKVEINAIMKGGFGPPIIDGELRSSCLYLRDQPIRNVISPLHFEGTTVSLNPIHGDIGDYFVSGLLESDVITDKVHLKLQGTGAGRGPALIFQMLNMKPYINTAKFEGRIDLAGDFDIFSDITGSIDIRLRDVRPNPDAFTRNNRSGGAWPRIPELNIDMFMQEGSLFIENIEAVVPGSRVRLGGRIDMTLDVELDKVSDTLYDLNFSIADDHTVHEPADSGRVLTMPAHFDGKLRLTTHQTDDSSDFKAGGAFELNNFRVQPRIIPFLKRISEYIDIYFRSVRGTMDIDGKAVHVRDLHLSGTWMEVRMDGQIGLDGALDLNAAARVLSREETDDTASILRLPAGIASKLKAGFRVTGTTAKPKLKLKRD